MPPGESNSARKLIEVENLSIRFKMSWAKTWNFHEIIFKKFRTKPGPSTEDHFTALSNVSFAARKGDIIGIIGANGCGKSTLLRTIGGIYLPDEGTVKVSGKVSSLLSLGTGFDMNMSAEDNIILNGLLLGMDLAEVKSKVSNILEFAELNTVKKKPMKYFSNGMISRLSFAIVQALEPDIILIDEIFSVGDLKFQRKSEKAMNELLRKASCQLIVSHDLELIEQVCNKVIYLKQGRIEMSGDPQQVASVYRKELEN